MARNKERCQEIYSRVYKVLTEQSTILKESWRTLFIRNIRRTMVRNQHQYYWTITAIKRKRYDCGNCKSIHKNDMTQSNDDDSIIARDYKNLLR